MMKRRTFLQAMSAAAALAGTRAIAQTAPAGREQHIRQAGKSLVFAGPGGTLGETLKGSFASFTAETGIQVNYLTGPILDIYGRLRAERNRPSIDVYWSNGVTESKGISDGAYTPLDPNIVTALDELYDLAKVPDNMGARMEFTDIGILFNRKAYDDRNIPHPTKWDDVWNDAVSGRIIIGDTTSFFTVLYVAYINKLLGGREDDPTRGIDFIAARKSKLMAVVRTYPERMQLLNSGEAWLTVDVGLTSIPETKKNPALAYVAPQEGSPLFWNGFHVVKGCPNPIGAQLLINHMISAPAQTKFATENFVGPANRTVTLGPDLAKSVPYGPEGLAKLVALDQGLIGDSLNKYRELWAARIAS